MISKIAIWVSFSIIVLATSLLPNFSFKDIADEINRLYGGTVKVNSTVRSGPMPHNGYRAFDPTATSSAFPDFKYTELFQGLSEIAKSGSE